MALLSLTMKRHLEDKFLESVPPSPPQSPVFFPSKLDLLNGLHAASMAALPIKKKRRKQLNPLSITADTSSTSDGNSDGSRDGCEVKMESPERFHEQIMRYIPYPNDNRHESVELSLINRETPVKKDFEQQHNIGPSTGASPLALLSQVASDVGGGCHIFAQQSQRPLNDFPILGQTGVPTGDFDPEPMLLDRPGSEGEVDPNLADSDSIEVCPECKKVFKRKVYLQRHMAREHWSAAKIFKCDKCSYETKHQSNLLVHRRTHTGERPYHCGACGQRYTQGHLLKAHIRSRHGANMCFYNMDKRTDGTRCKKLLGSKMERNFFGGGGGGGSGKEDKIRFLLQAAEAARQRPPAPDLSSMSMFNGLVSPSMNPYVNSLSACLPNGSRSMLWPHSLSSMMGTSTPFQHNQLSGDISSQSAAFLSSIQTSLSSLSSLVEMSKSSDSILSSMLSTLPNFSSSAHLLSNESPQKHDAAGSDGAIFKLPSLLAADLPREFNINNRHLANESKNNRHLVNENKNNSDRSHFQASELRHKGISSSLSSPSRHSLPTDVITPLHITDPTIHSSSPQSRDSFLANFPYFAQDSNNRRSLFSEILPREESARRCSPAEDLKNQTSQGNFLRESHLKSMLDAEIYSKLPRLEQPHLEQSHLEQPHPDEPADLSMHGKRTVKMELDRPEQQSRDVDRDSKQQNIHAKEEQAAVPAVGPVEPPSAAAHSVEDCREEEECCPYLKQLKELRRNVYRMLRVFTPYLGVGDVSDCEAGSIDEFLHEVIYSKLDEAD